METTPVFLAELTSSRRVRDLLNIVTSNPHDVYTRFRGRLDCAIQSLTGSRGAARGEGQAEINHGADESRILTG